MIAGALRYSRYPLPLRWFMRRIAKQAGGDTDTSRDYEYTDWGRVDDYARRLQIT
jgi:menaquinone-dependent protoporphyrinogen oxidase